MIIKIKKRILEQTALGILVTAVIGLIIVGISFNTEYVAGQTNITNNTVLARVNVTNTQPNITSVTVTDHAAPANSIDLISNSAVIVTCNATVADYNGWEDIEWNGTNATFYIADTGRDGATDNNYRYRNESCNSCRQADAASGEAFQGDASITALCDCRFGLQYYANYSDQWLCNMTVRDRGGTSVPQNETNLTSTRASSKTTITKLLSINTTLLLDYGNVSVTQISNEVIHNVTNAGNIHFNLTLRGYGGINEEVPHAGNYTMICAFGNISFNNQRYALGTDKEAIPFNDMRNLTNQTTRTNFTFLSRRNDANPDRDRNSTLWRLQVPLNVGGICNGTIVFGAIDAEVE